MDAPLAVKMFAALAHEHRLAVFRLLVKADSNGRSAGDVSAELGILPSTLSFHLSALENAGLIHSTRSGRYIHYDVCAENVGNLLDFLAEDCCGGHPKKCGFASSHRAKTDS